MRLLEGWREGRERREVESLLGVPLVVSGECWRWTGPTTQGYGKLYRDGVHQLAPRFVYGRIVGPIPAKHLIVQTCRDRLCVRPGHLRAVTKREQIRLSASPAGDCARKTTCKRGHPLDSGDPNVRVDVNGKHKRRCRACDAERARQKRHAKKAAA